MSLSTSISGIIDMDRGWVPDVEDASLYIRPFMFATDEYIGLKPSQTFQFIIFTCLSLTHKASMIVLKVKLPHKQDDLA